ncbi:MAG: hypothetical protein J6Y71_07680 [Ruminococcus sp.]|nr:hypothetical protein [Ruminococcus sp.]
MYISPREKAQRILSKLSKRHSYLFTSEDDILSKVKSEAELDFYYFWIWECGVR